MKFYMPFSVFDEQIKGKENFIKNNWETKYITFKNTHVTYRNNVRR